MDIALKSHHKMIHNQHIDIYYPKLYLNLCYCYCYCCYGYCYFYYGTATVIAVTNRGNNKSAMESGNVTWLFAAILSALPFAFISLLLASLCCHSHFHFPFQSSFQSQLIDRQHIHKNVHLIFLNVNILFPNPIHRIFDQTQKINI